MSKGFLVVAQNTIDVNYIDLSYKLASSIKKTQKINNISLLTNSKNKDIRKGIFDKVITLNPISGWNKYSKSTDTTSLCDKFYDYTPYDETIVLDADMLFTEDITFIWNALKKHDIIFTEKVKDFRGNFIKNDYYRKVFTENKLPNIYTAFFYFKKTEKTKVFFNLVKIIFNNWEIFFNEYLNDKFRPSFISSDVVYAIAYKILEFPNFNNNLLTFVHFKEKLQNVKDFGRLKIFKEDNKIFVNNYYQSYLFHYCNKNLFSEGDL